MSRPVISIASNIAEEAARQTKKEFAQFLHNAQGSLSELDTQITIAKRLRYLSEDVFKKLEIQLDGEDRMLTSLIESLRRDSKKLAERFTAYGPLSSLLFTGSIC